MTFWFPCLSFRSKSSTKITTHQEKLIQTVIFHSARKKMTTTAQTQPISFLFPKYTCKSNHFTIIFIQCALSLARGCKAACYLRTKRPVYILHVLWIFQQSGQKRKAICRNQIRRKLVTCVTFPSAINLRFRFNKPYFL